MKDRWDLLRVGLSHIDGGILFGGVAWTEYEQWVGAPNRKHQYLMETNCLFLEIGTHKILVDAGYSGWDWEENQYRPPRLLKSLLELGIYPKEITTVLLTSNADDHWRGALKLNRNGVIVPIFNKALHFAVNPDAVEALAGTRLEVAEMAEGQIVPGLEVCRLNGLAAITARVGGETILMPSDIVPTVWHALHPDVNLATDGHRAETLAWKAKYLKLAEETGGLIVFSHNTVLKHAAGVRVGYLERSKDERVMVRNAEATMR